MIDEKKVRATSVALTLLTIAHDAGFSDDDTFAAAQYIVDTHNEIARRNALAAICESNVIHIHRGRVEAPSRASRQPSIVGAGALRSVAALAPLSTENTEPAETGDNHRLGGFGGTTHVFD